LDGFARATAHPDLRHAFEHRHSARGAPRDHLVVLALAKGDAHFHVLRLHQAPDETRHVLPFDLVGVGSLVAFDDPATVGEQMSDDVRAIDARVLGLYVIGGALVLDVVIEAELRPVKNWALVLLFNLAERPLVERSDRLVQRTLLARHALHTLEGHLCDGAAWV